MSVMNQLKKFSENPEATGDQQAKFDRKFLNEAQDTKGATELDSLMTDVPIAGQSLTQSPDQRMPYEGPPEFTDQQDFIEHLFTELTGEDALPMVLESLRKQVPVEDAAHRILRGQLQHGKINTDLLLLSIEPTIYMLIGLATYAGIDPVLYPEGDVGDGEGKMIDKFKQGAQALTGDLEDDGQVDINDIQAPAVVPRNLMDRVGQAVSAIDSPDTEV